MQQARNDLFIWSYQIIFELSMHGVAVIVFMYHLVLIWRRMFGNANSLHGKVPLSHDVVQK